MSSSWDPELLFCNVAGPFAAWLRPVDAAGVNTAPGGPPSFTTPAAPTGCNQAANDLLLGSSRTTFGGGRTGGADSVMADANAHGSDGAGGLGDDSVMTDAANARESDGGLGGDDSVMTAGNARESDGGLGGSDATVLGGLGGSVQSVASVVLGGANQFPDSIFGPGGRASSSSSFQAPSHGGREQGTLGDVAEMLCSRQTFRENLAEIHAEDVVLDTGAGDLLLDDGALGDMRWARVVEQGENLIVNVQNGVIPAYLQDGDVSYSSVGCWSEKSLSPDQCGRIASAGAAAMRTVGSTITWNSQRKKKPQQRFSDTKACRSVPSSSSTEETANAPSALALALDVTSKADRWVLVPSSTESTSWRLVPAAAFKNRNLRVVTNTKISETIPLVIVDPPDLEKLSSGAQPQENKAVVKESVGGPQHASATDDAGTPSGGASVVQDHAALPRPAGGIPKAGSPEETSLKWSTLPASEGRASSSAALTPRIPGRQCCGRTEEPSPRQPPTGKVVSTQTSKSSSAAASRDYLAPKPPKSESRPQTLPKPVTNPPPPAPLPVRKPSQKRASSRGGAPGDTSMFGRNEQCGVMSGKEQSGMRSSSKGSSEPAKR